MKANQIRKERENDESNNEFAAMLEGSLGATDDFAAGDEVEGVIASVNRETAFVDIAGKSEAVIAAGELKSDDAEYKSGDKIRCFVAKARGGTTELTMRIGEGFISDELITKARSNELPVTGTVKSLINGGYEVYIGTYRAFCPFSQIDIRKNDDDKIYLNKKFLFKITEAKQGLKNLVVSRRAFLEVAAREGEEKLKSTLKEGDILDCHITRIAEFGVFADFGGIEGLIPRSELSLSRLTRTEDFKIGDKVKAKLMTMDWAAKKFSLSIKQTLKDPWKEGIKFKVGETFKGTITNTIKAGAFVEIAPGVEGLIPLQNMSFTKRIVKADDVVQTGQSVNVKIASIDHNEKRISFELITGETNPWEDNASLSDSIIKGKVESINIGGVVVRLDNGMEGFIPKAELLAPRGADLNKAYPAGKEIEVFIMTVDNAKRRVSASEKRITEMREQKELHDYMKKNDQSLTSSSSLGSQFKDVLEKFKG